MKRKIISTRLYQPSYDRLVSMAKEEDISISKMIVKLMNYGLHSYNEQKIQQGRRKSARNSKSIS